MEENAQKKTQRERGFGELHLERQSSRQGGIQEVSEGDWYKCLSIGGQAGVRRDLSQFADLLGGIIDQLLESEEARLKEAEECVDWYKREKEKVSRRVENLKQLQILAKTELPSSAEIEETE